MAQSQEVMPPEPPPADASIAMPRRAAPANHVNAGTVAIESERAIAEAQGKLIVAQRCPRNVMRAEADILAACKEMTLAEEAFYQYDKGGSQVRGPSIRLAEELARCWGNIEYGIKELSQKQGVSEMQAFAWDLQTNTISTQNFTVSHIRDTRQGPKPLTSQRDIYELTANMGGRRLRARIMAILPKSLIAMAVESCEATIRNGGGVTIAERIRKMIGAFQTFGVSVEMMEKKLGKPLAQATADDLVVMQGTFTSIRDGMSSVAAQFSEDGEGAEPEAVAPAAHAIASHQARVAAEPPQEPVAPLVQPTAQPAPPPTPQTPPAETPPAPKAPTVRRQTAVAATPAPVAAPPPTPAPPPPQAPTGDDDETLF